MKEALVEVDGELAVVDANAQRRVGAEDEEVVFASPFPNLKLKMQILFSIVFATSSSDFDVIVFMRFF